MCRVGRQTLLYLT